MLAGIQHFERESLRHVAETKEAEAEADPKEDILQKIKSFQRGSLRPVEKLPSSKPPVATVGDASGFLNTLLTAMRTRRVLVDDFDFDSARRASASSEADRDDMFEADWT